MIRFTVLGFGTGDIRDCESPTLIALAQRACVPRELIVLGAAYPLRLLADGVSLQLWRADQDRWAVRGVTDGLSSGAMRFELTLGTYGPIWQPNRRRRWWKPWQREGAWSNHWTAGMKVMLP
jgi:hypothetical protein